MRNDDITRRSFLGSGSVLAAGSMLTTLGTGAGAVDLNQVEKLVKNGRIRQAVSRWCYKKWSLDELCEVCTRLGILGIDLQGPEAFPTLKKHGLVCTMVSSHKLPNGLCDKQFHAECLAKLRTSIEAASDAGYPNVISFSGNRRGIPDDVGIENAVLALKEVVGYAESKKVTICLEYLNSKV
ncbi:MAG: sugar phosphate isomerase/epimerase, partial [Bacteroidales bacterium]|nr:sugar phosphate isomerase/epimerase [Bacteroidales bacterium]